jgi:hypothetical protein
MTYYVQWEQNFFPSLTSCVSVSACLPQGKAGHVQLVPVVGPRDWQAATKMGFVLSRSLMGSSSDGCCYLASFIHWDPAGCSDAQWVLEWTLLDSVCASDICEKPECEEMLSCCQAIVLGHIIRTGTFLWSIMLFSHSNIPHLTCIVLGIILTLTVTYETGAWYFKTYVKLEKPVASWIDFRIWREIKTDICLCPPMYCGGQFVPVFSFGFPGLGW